jgi:protein required for attachment to host cells
LRSRIAILIVKAVIQPEYDQFAHVTAPTTFGELREIHNSISR